MIGITNLYYFSYNQLEEIGNLIEREYIQEDFELFLSTWSPWIKYRKKSEFPEYDKIPTDDNLELATVCCITYDRLENPIVYGGNTYEYENFRRVYSERGKDPFNQQEINIDALKRPAK